MRGMLPELPGAVRRVAEHVLADPAGSMEQSILDLADRCGTSPSTVSRLCRSLGLSGYPALRLAVVAEAAGSSWDRDITGEINEIKPSDSLGVVARRLGAAQARAVKDTLARLDLRAVGEAADAVVRAGRVDLYGVSGSAIMAVELQLRLHRIGVSAWAWSDVHEGLTGAALLRPGDAAIAISYSGATRETLDMLSCAHDHGATTVAITGDPRSPIASVADVILPTVAQDTTFRDGPLAARHSELTVVELLYVAVGQRTYERTVRALSETAAAVRPHRVDNPAVSGHHRSRRRR